MKYFETTIAVINDGVVAEFKIIAIEFENMFA